MENDFISNYRGARSQTDNNTAIPLAPNFRYKSVGLENEWDHKRINQILRNRSAYAPEESPYLSLNVDIPVTTNTRKIQAGKLKLLNDVNNTALSKDMALYIVGNTYQDNDDGTHYGLNWDGRPYSYKIEGNEVKDFEPLGAEEQKKVIEKLTNGNVKVNGSIDNTGTLAQIYRSIKKMQDFQKGNLVPGKVNVSDPDPNYGSEYGLLGFTTFTDKDDGSNDVMLFNADFPQLNKTRKMYEKGTASSSHPDYVTAHEISHAADFNRIEAANKYNKLHGLIEDEGGGSFDMFKQAAKNSGFDNVQDAVATISSYALNDDYEAFADAYVDVLYNKDNAKPFSKELVRLYNEQVDKLAKVFGPKDPAAFRKEYGLSNGLMTERQLKDAVVNYEQIKKRNNPFSR